MQIKEIEIGKQYILEYKNIFEVVTVLSISKIGDCQIKFKNGKKDLFSCEWIKPLKQEG